MSQEYRKKGRNSEREPRIERQALEAVAAEHVAKAALQSVDTGEIKLRFAGKSKTDLVQNVNLS